MENKSRTICASPAREQRLDREQKTGSAPYSYHFQILGRDDDSTISGLICACEHVPHILKQLFAGSGSKRLQSQYRWTKIIAGGLNCMLKRSIAVQEIELLYAQGCDLISEEFTYAFFRPPESR